MAAIDARKLCGSGDFFVGLFASRPGVSTELRRSRGHLEGDRTLRDVADHLRAGVRIFDVCARYGGDEFVIVMPAASVTVAQQVAERIRGRTERSFSHDSPPVAVSIGVGMLGGRATADELVDVADRALIAAKRAGKNLVWTGLRLNGLAK